MTLPAALERQARRWLSEDPDANDRDELVSLLEDQSPAAEAELADRFADRLRFGTAGLRAAVAAGPNRMNRALVRMATSALAVWLDKNQPGARSSGVVLGCDARHRSSDFLDEAARVLVGAGFRVHLLTERRPTPLLAFAVRYLGTAAGVMITASHNPPADNGYKLYLADGAQIIPPVDEEIEALMSEIGPLGSVRLGDVKSPLVTRYGREIERAYLEALVGALPTPAARGDLSICYTPLHGVAAGLFADALVLAGLPAPCIVAAQERPDPDFPTVAFPNPEEPGAMDLALEQAGRILADVVIANDPDGDRLAVAVPDPEEPGCFSQLTGDQAGSILGAYLIERTGDEPDAGSRIVASTVVSSSLLSKVAARAGVHYAETLTGFKWVARATDAVPGSRFLFGYEEALGYCVESVVRDKDGIGAALAWLNMTAEAKSRGESVLSRLDELEKSFGVHHTTQLSVRLEAPAETMAQLRANPPGSFGREAVLGSVDLASTAEVTHARYAGLPAADVLVYLLEEARVVVRPSGTEPKLKVYFEVVQPVDSGDLARARKKAAQRIEALRRSVEALIGGG
jgi:phosphomannomutase